MLLPSVSTSSTPEARAVLLALLTGTVVCVLIVLGGSGALGLLLVGALLGVAGTIAYRYPPLTVAGWVLLSLHLPQLLRTTSLGPLSGGIDLRLADPVLAGIALALTIKLLMGDLRTARTLLYHGFFWTLLVAWLFFQLAVSIPQYGFVRPLGEFRTYFSGLLVLPYVVIFFRTRHQQQHLFRLLLGLAFLLIPIALIGGARLQFQFGLYLRWLNSYATLALLWGALGLYLLYRSGFWRGRTLTVVVMQLAALGLVVLCAHRSVWLAAAVCLVGLLLLRQLAVTDVLKLGALLVVSSLVLTPLYLGDTLTGFLSERLTAFTNAEADATASWRLHIWRDALEQSQAFLLQGKGLGSYFQTQGPHGATVQTALHNQYIQLLYQTGLIGLVLYTGFIAQTTLLLWRARRRIATDSFPYLIITMALLVLAGVSAYYFAYIFDVFTWVVVGLGLAVVLGPEPRA